MAQGLPQAATVTNVLKRKLIFVSGKGGVGKSVITQAIAQALSTKGHRTLWILFEDPFRPLGELVQLSKYLWMLNCESTKAFEEYAGLKIGVPALTRLFLQNKLMRYLAKAAPGIHELVLLGKVWHDSAQYDHVVLDMPSTGYGLAMFHSVGNFARLFRGGPIHHDAEAMMGAFHDPKETGQLIVALPEEMPLRESLELNEFLLKLFPNNSPAFLVNRVFPRVRSQEENFAQSPDSWPSPVPSSAMDYVHKRTQLEEFNLRLWKQEGIPFGELPFIAPPLENPNDFIVGELAKELQARAYL
jgi:anion-transporting  ArsA/GET3 family ATPase